MIKARTQPAARIAAIAAAFTFLGTLVLATPASAVLVRSSSGHVLGVMLKHTVNPASVPGVIRTKRKLQLAADNGSVSYHGGPVLHTSDPYLIFWDPTGTGISAPSRAVFVQYLTDIAAAGASSTDVYGVVRQYTDATGFAAAGQSFNSGTQVISDTDAFPATASPCGGANCVTDAQIQQEIHNLISAHSLPTGTGAGAPIYFVVTPASEDVCADIGQCASNSFCAYHASFTDGAATVLYSSIPMLAVGTSGKGCQTDDHSTVPVFQQPNGDRADNGVDQLSHENSESITDPVTNPTATGWFDDTSGEEVADNCASWGPTVDPVNGANPNAYLPVLGGVEANGTMFDQLINGNHYYTQTEWSNGDVGTGGCETQPTASASGFTSNSPMTPHSSMLFTPAVGLSSSSWDFGDGTTAPFSTTRQTVAHIYTSPGTYNATLTAVDTHGNLATTTHQVVVANLPTPSFTASSGAAGSPIAFNAAASSDPNPGGSISSYSWNFGDGSPPGAGVAPTHAFSSVGFHTVTLTVTNSAGLSAALPHAVAALPVAAIQITTRHPATRQAVAFTATRSRDPGGVITAYRWRFGDGTSGSGATASHTYAHAGAYAVSLTITDRSGLNSTATTRVTVATAGRITKVAASGKLLRVTVSGPGTLRLGSKRFTARKAGTLKVPIPLSGAQSRQLGRAHALKLTLALTFVPLAGPTEHLSPKVTVHG
jgi:PKD repeat protein